MITHYSPKLAAVLTFVALLCGVATTALADPPPHAKAWGHESRQVERRYYDHRYDDRGRYDRDHRYYGDDRYYDRGHRHDRSCDHRDRDVRRIVVVDRLPYGHRYIDYRGARYFYDRRGDWYLPYGRAWTRIAAPAGLRIDSRGIAVVTHVPVVRW